MGKKIGLHIDGRKFDVDAEDNFAPFLMQEMSKDFNIEGNNELTTVIQGYVRKVYALYLQEKKIEEISNQLVKNSDFIIL